jgi:hypothetical protein
MSYYNLPKNYSLKYNIKPIIDGNIIIPYTSYSLYNYYNTSIIQLQNCLSESNISNDIFENLSKDINPFEYIFSKIPGVNFSVSKLKPKSNIFYDFLEIFNTLNICDNFYNKNINCIHISKNYLDSIDGVSFFRENKIKESLYFEEINDNIFDNDNDNDNDNVFSEKKYDFIFYEIEKHNLENLNSYIINLIQIIMIIFKYQQNNGVCLIKIGHIFHKPVIDILYILSSMYSKTYIIKPNTSNIISFDKYIVCKNFILNEQNTEIYKNNYLKFKNFLTSYSINQKQKPNTNQNIHISKIIDYDLPYYFMNKIDDMNIIIGQQQLESIDQIINILKNKNKEDRIETFRKTNIQKSINWCEKFKIPCNKFSERSNIFLPLKNDNDTNNEEILII